MRRAFLMIRPQPNYRREAFADGLKAAGCEVRGAPSDIRAGDVLCIWNRYGEYHDLACRFERAGGIVLVAENGYIGPGGISPHQMQPREWYALAIGGHNGSGTWPVGGPERWAALGVELQPWRSWGGEHILICPNRAFGRPDLIMPLNWATDVKARLERVTKREIRIRPHPGNNSEQKKPLTEDLAGAWACVIWSSSAGVQALIAGVPVISEAPAWICANAAYPSWVAARSDAWDALNRDRATKHDSARASEMQRLAWAQFHYREIATGEPITRMIEHAMNREAAAA